jgi:hypothetical protein
MEETYKAAGIDPRPSYCSYSKEELLDYIIYARDVFDFIPSSEEWKTKCQGFPSVSTFYRRFEGMSWGEIVNLAERYRDSSKTLEDFLKGSKEAS